MTSHATVNLTCAHCQHVFAGDVLCSTNTFGGSPELDTRPCGMAREAFLGAIYECPECHYCAPDIQTLPEGGASAMTSERYQATLNNKNLPRLTRQWSCSGQILEAAELFAEAGWAYLSAAWACDDSSYEDEAKNHRRAAIGCFRKAQERKESFGEDTVSEIAILVDLYRRIGEFETADSLAGDAIESLKSTGDDGEQLISQILVFQRHLCAISNPNAFTFTQAEEFAGKPEGWKPPKWWEFWK